MARLIKDTVTADICAKIITRFANGTSTEKLIKVGDIVENLRYVKNEEICTITGKVVKITTTINKVSMVNLNKPEDYFTKDVILKSIVVDASEQYESKVVAITAREIIEDEGVVDVVKVDHIPYPMIAMDMEYSDGSIKNQSVEIGDILADMDIIPGITGTFRVAAFYYINNKSIPQFKGFYLSPVGGGKAIKAAFENIIGFEEKDAADVTDTKSLAQIANALNESETGNVYATLEVDVDIPKREDGRITTLMVNEGQELTIDLNGHNIDCQAYAFYVNGGTLNITGDGAIVPHIKNAAYPAVMVASGGVCNMENGVIDTTKVELPEETDYNWLYGVVCSGDGVFNMTGGKMIIGDAAGISITNGTASGVGAQFNIGGDAVIKSVDCTAIYLADNKSVDISGNAKIEGGILLRLGELTVRENASVVSHEANYECYPLGKLVTESGCESHTGAILAITGIYKSDLGNDLNIVIKDNATVKSLTGNGIDFATVNTKYDQNVTLNIENSKKISYKQNLWNIFDHDTLAEMAQAQGKTLAPETNVTNLTVTIDDEQVFPEL